MSDRNELRLTSQVAELVVDLARVELQTIVKDHHSRDIESSDDILPDELPCLYNSDVGNVFCLYPFNGLGKGPKISIPHMAKGRADDRI